MVSLKDPKTWIPHPKDCSKKICKLYCTKWCRYIIVPSPPPPPPPPPPVSKDDLGGSTLSPVVIVIISLIGSFFLLIGFYVIVSCYCLRNNESSVLLSRRVETHETRDPESRMDDEDEDEDQEDDNSDYVPWLILGKGLDEGLIKSITICKYKKGNGLVSCTDCSICLGEFQEDESLRLLPKCVHAFHIYCIDTWLKTHLNCPLCRANVCFEVKDSLQISQPPPPPSPLATTSEL